MRFFDSISSIFISIRTDNHPNTSECIRTHLNMVKSDQIFIRRFRNFHSGASGARVLLGGTGRAFSLEVASFALTFKFSEAPEALRARIFARSGPPALNFGSPGRSWARFWKPKHLDLRGFSTLAHNRCVHCPRPTKHCVGARILSFELLHDTTKTTQNHSASVLNSARCTKCARRPLRSRPGASQDPPVETFGWFPGALGPPPTPQDRSRGLLLASQTRPECVPETISSAQSHPR